MAEHGLRLLQYLFGPNYVTKIVKGVKDEGLSRIDAREKLKEHFGNYVNLDRLQVNSWYLACNLKPSNYDRKNKLLVVEVMESLERPLIHELNDLYFNESLSMKDIADNISKRSGRAVSKSAVNAWFSNLGIPTRTISENCNIRWSKEEEREKASLKTIEYFKTDEGKKRKIELSRWNAEVWGKRFSISKLEKYFESEFLSGLNYESQKQFRFPDRKLTVADFFIEGKIVEVNGDYWHSHPSRYPDARNKDSRVKRTVAKDVRKAELYKSLGIPCLYIWESDIKRNPGLVRELLEKFLSGENLESCHSYDYR